MITILDELIRKTENDPLESLELTAKFLDMSASSKIDQVIEYNQKLNKVFSVHKNKTPFMVPLELLTDGASNYYLTNYEKSLELLERAEMEFKPGMPKDILGVIYWAKGNCNRSLGNFDLAVEFQIKASENINPKGVFTLSYGYVKYQLGELHLAIHEIDEAIKYFEEALSIVQNYSGRASYTDITANFRINNGLGNCYLLLGKYDLAKKYLDVALNVSGISRAEKARGLCDLGRLNIRLGEFTIAEEQLNTSLEVREQVGLEDASSTSMIYLAEVYIRMGRAKEAIDILYKAKIITDKFNAQGKQIKLYKFMSEAFEQINNISESLVYFKKYDILKSEVRNRQEHNIFNLKNRQIEEQRKVVQEKNNMLKNALNELARVKTSRKSLVFSVLTAIILVFLTEVFLDPLIDSYAYNNYISLGVKIIIALMLKPMETFYERLLLRRALKIA